MSPTPQEESHGPRVSVIFLTYNQAAALRRAVAAIEQSQQRERIEILVADCGSSDDSSKIDAEFPAVNVLRLPHHLGAARAMNIATRTAKADLVLYLSPEVDVEPGTIAALADRLEASGEDIAAVPMLVDEKGGAVAHVFAIPGAEALGAAARGGSLAAVSVDASAESAAVEYATLDALMAKKAFVRGMNFFDERYGHYWADLDLAMQARRAGKKVHVYPGIRAVKHAAPDPLAGDSLALADRIAGAAAFLGKYGSGGFGLRMGAAFGALAKFDFGLFSAVLSGSKLDGSQGA